MKSIIPFCLLLTSLPLLAEPEQTPTADSAAIRTGVDSRVLIPEDQVTLQAVEQSIRRGVDYLVAKQNANGSFGGATRTKGLNIYAPLPGAHDAFLAGASTLALAGLVEIGKSFADLALSRPRRRLRRGRGRRLLVGFHRVDLLLNAIQYARDTLGNRAA